MHFSEKVTSFIEHKIRGLLRKDKKYTLPKNGSRQEDVCYNYIP